MGQKAHSCDRDLYSEITLDPSFLNFFRFIDNLKDSDSHEPQLPMIDSIYEKIAKLNDTELSKFLYQAGSILTDTAEFNFYGAHLIDFATVKSITYRGNKFERNVEGKEACVIDFDKLREELRIGDAAEYDKVRYELPELLTSARFMDFIESEHNTFLLNR